MASGWDVNVYRTDTEAEQYVGFFLDEGEADRWIKRQKQGVFEKRSRSKK